MNFRDFLAEMFIHGERQERSFVIAFRSNLWLIPFSQYNEPGELGQSILDSILVDHPDNQELKAIFFKYKQEGDIAPSDVADLIMDKISDGLIGTWDPEKRELEIRPYGSSGITSSPLIKKVATSLGAKSVNYTDHEDNTSKFRPRQLLGDFTGKMYHGTCSKYIKGIMSLGINPGEAPTNYPGVHHPDKIFLATNFDEAASHSFHTCTGARILYPIVIELKKIPDPAKIVPDYDVDRDASRNTYSDLLPKNSYYSVSSDRASKHAGLIGYGGRIPVSYFAAVWVWAGNKWYKITPSRFNAFKKQLDDPEDYFVRRYGFGYTAEKRY